jgi:hypothetical protein
LRIERSLAARLIETRRDGVEEFGPPGFASRVIAGTATARADNASELVGNESDSRRLSAIDAEEVLM